MTTPQQGPQTDAEWARNTEKRLRLLESPRTVRIGPWVIGSVDGTLVATKPGEELDVGGTSTTSTTVDLSTRGTTVVELDEATKDQITQDVTDSVNEGLDQKITDQLNALVPGLGDTWIGQALATLIAAILGIPGDLTALGAFLAGKWTDLTNAMNDASLALQKFGSLLVAAAVSTIDALGSLIASAFATAQTALTNAGIAIGNIATILFNAAVNTVEELGAIIASALSKANTSLTNAGIALSHIGGLLGTVGMETMEALGALINGSWEKAQEAFADAGEALGQIGQMLFNAAVSTAEALGSLVAGAFAVASTAATNALSALGQIGQVITNAVVDTAAAVGSLLASAAQTANTALTNAASALGQIGQMITNAVVDGAAALGSLLANAASTANTALTNAGSALGQLGQMIGNAVADTAATLGSMIAGTVSTANTAITNAGTALGQLGQMIEGAAANTFTEIGNWVTNAWEGTQATWNNMWGAIFGGNPTGKTAADLKTAAQSVNSTATTASANASTGIANAAAAQSTANTAQSTATTAQSTANTANSTANTANTNATTANTNLQTTWNGLTTGLSNQTTEQTNTTTTSVAQTSKQLAAANAANAAAITRLQTPPTVAVSGGGRSIGVDFTTRTASTTSIVGGAPSADFTVTYSGAGSATYGIINGVADWTKTGAAARSMQARYSLNPLFTDYQIVTVAVSAWQGYTATTYGTNYVFARMNAAGTSYVYAKIQANTAELGYAINGSRTPMTTYTVPSSGWLGSMPLIMSATTITLVCGTTGGARQYKVLVGGETVITWTESGTSSQMGASYRYTGFGGDMVYGLLNGSNTYAPPSPVGTFNAVDNAPATYLGSGFRAYRTSTSNLAMPTTGGYNAAGTLRNDGREYVPFSGGTLANFFNTKEYATTDLTFNVAADGVTATNDSRVTVSNDGWYMVNLCIGFAINTMVVDIAPALFKNSATVPLRKGNAAWGVNQLGIVRGPSSVSSTFTLYLNAGDYLIPGYWTTPIYAPGGSFLGDGSGLTCYFEMTLMNRSFF